nr:homeobox-DDT domain protein RLT1 isoform X2 [Ipomoea batatas]
MEGGSEGEESNKNANHSPSDGGQHKKPKRQMKTPFQLQTLEKAYAMETYPTEATRAELSDKLGLTDRQLQMWFCHRRLKDKKEAAGGSAVKPRVGHADGIGGKRSFMESPRDEEMAEPGSDHGSGSGSGSRSSQFDNGDDMPTGPLKYYEPPRVVKQHQIIACIEVQLGHPLREDGPVLGVEFDELPPGAFGASIVETQHRDRYQHSYERMSFGSREAKQINTLPKTSCEPAVHKARSDRYGQVGPSYIYDSPVNGPSAKTLSVTESSGNLPREYCAEGHASSANLLFQQSRQGQFSSPTGDGEFIPCNEGTSQMERKRKTDEARTEREVQAHEKRIRKELEKQDLLRKKMEEQMKKEMEKQDRERRKEEKRMMREQQRMEERFQREERREMERREKFMQKELIKAERKRQKEELRREREAAKQKAAMERAAARKFAKESMELIEDERLELMELAASSKGLPSILSLDYNTLQNLELFREFLCDFPPKSVQMKKPFPIQPWIDSDDNVGNLLMAWRFCLNFADVLELWPFTLDEFVQSFHDYDSRLLSEIHIVLLKLIIKDIEDVARTPSGGPGTNQYSAVNPEGGHPKIVEGAYLWGFNICNWKKHLNLLTWPEVLRQLGLSAGFGPQLKKKKKEGANFNDSDETKGCEDIVSTLRSGSAAENAVAVMQEKGHMLQRKSRHRLTPGTVKFAAYHVLALEGEKGLNVIDLAEKIQKSGLRDLRTSKTPEASISVALSRDPVLFERIAPSTYCVRPAFRKDPADAEAIISAAREKIQRYLNGFLAGQNGDDEERDDDSECDATDVPEVDDLGTPSAANKPSDQQSEVEACSLNEKDILPEETLPNGFDTVGIRESNPGQEGEEIDESKSGEPWVQGLTEGEYSDLCVEERLNALTALISLANEGNSIRAILEERLDAANALKKQMWAEAQLDKRRTKDENLNKLPDSSFNAVAEGSQSPLAIPDYKNHEASSTAGVNETSTGNTSVKRHLEIFSAEKSSVAQEVTTNLPSGHTAERSRMQLKSFIGHKAEEMYVYRSLPLGQDRRRNRYWLFVASGSSHDPGSGRIFVESPGGCWKVIDTEEAFDALLTSLETRGIRESHLHMMLQKIEVPFRERVRSTISNADSMVQHRNTTGNEATEASISPACYANVDSPNSMVCNINFEGCEYSSSFKIELGRNEVEKGSALRKYQDFQIWMWKEFFGSSNLCSVEFLKKRCSPLLGICDACLDSYLFEEGLCPSCHRAFGKVDGIINFLEPSINVDRIKVDSKDLIVSSPPRIRMIKALLSMLEVSIPSEALQPSWTEECRRIWGLRLQNSSSTEDLLQNLTQLEGFLKHDYLSSSFETTKELLGCSTSRFTACHSAFPGSVPELPWIPQTTAAVGLRLLELDAAVSYDPDQNTNELKVSFIKPALGYASTKNLQKVEPMVLDQNGQLKEENWNYSGSAPGRQVARSKGFGRPGGRWPKETAASVSGSSRPSARHSETLTQVLMQQGEAQGHKHSRGRRTMRRRRTEKLVIDEIQPGDEENLERYAQSPRSNGHEREAIDMNIGRMQVDNDDNSSSEESDDSAQENPYEFGKRQVHFKVSNRGDDMMEITNDDVDDSSDDDQCGYPDYNQNLGGDVDMEDGEDELDGNGDSEDDQGSDSEVHGDYSD